MTTTAPYPIPELIPLIFEPSEQHLAALDYAETHVRYGRKFICCLVLDAVAVHYCTYTEGCELRTWVSRSMGNFSRSDPYEDWIREQLQISGTGEQLDPDKVKEARLIWIGRMKAAIRDAMTAET